MRALEAELNPSRTDFDPAFPHPSDASLCIQVMIIMDACNMLEQVWNSHGDIGIRFDSDGETTRRDQLAALNQLQETEGLRLGNKLANPSDWWEQKMKVNLAARSLSTSVADVLQYCHRELKLGPFWRARDSSNSSGCLTNCSIS